MFRVRGYAASSEHHPDSGRSGHGKRPPEGHADGALENARTSGGGAEATENRQGDQRCPGHDEADLRRGRKQDDDQRDSGADREGERGDNGGLDRMGGHRLGDPQFVAGMRPQRIPLGQLHGDLPASVASRPRAQ